MNCPVSTKCASTFGIAGPLVVVLSILLAIALSPWFNFWENALSDLGVSPVAPIFNGGLIVGGILIAIFTRSLWCRLEISRPLKACGFFLLFGSMIGLCCVGVFTEDYGRFHFQVSVVFFVLLLAASLVLGIGMVRVCELRSIGVVAIGATIIGIIAWCLPIWDGIAIPEMLSGIPGFLWIALLGDKLRKGSADASGLPIN